MHVPDDVNLHILRMLEGMLSLDAALLCKLTLDAYSDSEFAYVYVGKMQVLLAEDAHLFYTCTI